MLSRIIICIWGNLNFLLSSGQSLSNFVTIYYCPEFTVYTDNNPLTYVMSSAKLNATSHRSVAELADFRFKVKYCPGSSHKDADFFSRMPTDIHYIIQECCHKTSLLAIEATCHAVFVQKNNHISWVLSLTINSETVSYNPFQEDKLDFKPLPSSSIQAYQESDPAISHILSYKSLQRNLTKGIVRMSQLRLKCLCENGKTSLLVRMVCFIGGMDKFHNWSYISTEETYLRTAS